MMRFTFLYPYDDGFGIAVNYLYISVSLAFMPPY